MEARQQSHEHPVETVFLRRTRAARCADHRTVARGSDEQKIAGIDRHAEMLDAPADRRDRGGDDVASVGNGGRPKHDDELGALPQHLLDRGCERALLMRHATLRDDAGARGCQAFLGDL